MKLLSILIFCLVSRSVLGQSSTEWQMSYSSSDMTIETKMAVPQELIYSCYKSPIKPLRKWKIP